MNDISLGRLEKVELRECWKTEAGDFTPWLAKEENIVLLGETIGLSLEVEAQEKEVGPFRADILCKDTVSGNWVLIENQLEKTDHIHLGQLLTYASGLNAVTIVWIADKFIDEHRAALDWLNEITDESFSFFGLEVELWRIASSPLAPKFNIVSKPNNWIRNVSGAAKQMSNAALTETKLLQQDFWKAFCSYLEQASSNLRTAKPLPQHWLNVALGRGGARLNAIASTWNYETGLGEIRAEVEFFDKNSKAFFAILERKKDEIEADLGEPLTWYNPQEAQVCRIFLQKTADISQRQDWDNQHAWLKEKLESLHRVFAPRVRAIDPDEYRPETEVSE